MTKVLDFLVTTSSPIDYNDAISRVEVASAAVKAAERKSLLTTLYNEIEKGKKGKPAYHLLTEEMFTTLDDAFKQTYNERTISIAGVDCGLSSTTYELYVADVALSLSNHTKEVLQDAGLSAEDRLIVENMPGKLYAYLHCQPHIDILGRGEMPLLTKSMFQHMATTLKGLPYSIPEVRFIFCLFLPIQ